MFHRHIVAPLCSSRTDESIYIYNLVESVLNYYSMKIGSPLKKYDIFRFIVCYNVMEDDGRGRRAIDRLFSPYSAFTLKREWNVCLICDSRLLGEGKSASKQTPQKD